MARRFKVAMTEGSNVEIGNPQRVPHDEFSSWFDHVAHQS